LADPAAVVLVGTSTSVATVVVTVQLELPHPELDGGSEKILVVVVVDTLVMLVVNVLQPVMV
jgi:hypothetical protein